MRRLWAIAMFSVIVVSAVYAVFATYHGEPLSLLLVQALAGWLVGYGLARIAEAFKVQLW